METLPDMTKTVHHGRNIRRFREMLNIKQEGLAYELGGDWSQKKVSLLEQKEIVEQEILEEVAKILNVPAEAIKKFDEQSAVNIIAQTVNNHDQSASVFYNPVFNPIEKWIEALEENKSLYERLLKSEQEKVVLLQKLLDGKA